MPIEIVQPMKIQYTFLIEKFKLLLTMLQLLCDRNVHGPTITLPIFVFEVLMLSENVLLLFAFVYLMSHTKNCSLLRKLRRVMSI